jgi:hypothetical protein
LNVLAFAVSCVGCADGDLKILEGNETLKNNFFLSGIAKALFQFLACVNLV